MLNPINTENNNEIKLEEFEVPNVLWMFASDTRPVEDKRIVDVASEITDQIADAHINQYDGQVPMERFTDLLTPQLDETAEWIEADIQGGLAEYHAKEILAIFNSLQLLGVTSTAQSKAITIAKSSLLRSENIYWNFIKALENGDINSYKSNDLNFLPAWVHGMATPHNKKAMALWKRLSTKKG
jgi:hypothetical protein